MSSYQASVDLGAFNGQIVAVGAGGERRGLAGEIRAREGISELYKKI